MASAEPGFHRKLLTQLSCVQSRSTVREVYPRCPEEAGNALLCCFLLPSLHNIVEVAMVFPISVCFLFYKKI